MRSYTKLFLIFLLSILFFYWKIINLFVETSIAVFFVLITILTFRGRFRRKRLSKKEIAEKELGRVI